jgi:uncharacterized protein YcbK (DUF882 family)
VNYRWTRRNLIQTAIAGGAGLALSRLAGAQEAEQGVVAALPERSIALVNTHTNESAHVVFRRGEHYVPAALETLKTVLRDHRNGEAHDMDPKLFDHLHELAQAVRREPHFEIISGYRSAESNDKMSARAGSGVAKKSLHMQGRAIDVRLKNCPCSTLRDLALAAKKGGVGYYAKSDFVHIDTGSFRTWVG